MAKSKSQRMKEYRERKKALLGDKWLQYERNRVKGYYVPINELDEPTKEKKRMLNKIRQARFRDKKKRNNQADREDGPASSTSDDTVTTSGNTPLTVKLPFKLKKSKSSSGKKRVSRALARSYRKNEMLSRQNNELRRKLKTAQRKLQRSKSSKNPNTPRSKADKVIRESGIKPENVPEIRKKLVFGECLVSEIQSAKNLQGNNCKNTDVVHRVASGKIIKKYRLKRTLEKETKLNRKKKLLSKSVALEKKKRLSEYRKCINEEIVAFLERDDNSRQLPGKADAVKTDGEKVQKRVLNDFMYNIHMKFTAESTTRVSRSLFYNARPKHISLVNFASRSVCLCSKHQNFCFLLRTLKCLNVTTCTNPDKFVDTYKANTESLEEVLQTIPDDGEDIQFQQWKRVKLDNGKERQRVVEIKKKRNEFIEITSSTFLEFRDHIDRVRQQYCALKQMKDKISDSQVIIQMDFSENYTCSSLEEIQSAYWNNCMITLHPVVIYYKIAGILKHASYVYVSEILSHNATMVLSIIERVMAVVKDLVPSVKSVHFWTDSPSSQYRNKTIFNLISRFYKLYGTTATWQYFESGHGKGPCDGIGGTTKRNADNAVKQGKTMIQDATDFYAWASKHEQGIKYELVTEGEFNIQKADVEKRNALIKPIKGSMTLHSVIGTESETIGIRNTTCACNNCFDGHMFNLDSDCGWEKYLIQTKTSSKNKTAENENRDELFPKSTEVNSAGEIENSDTVISVDKYVVALYLVDGKYYIGKVIEVDSKDNTVLLSFMTECEKVPGRFKWPPQEDKVWVRKDNIIQLIDAPTQTSKTGRMFTVPENIVQLVGR